LVFGILGALVSGALRTSRGKERKFFMNARSVLRNCIPYAVSATVTGILLHATDAGAVYREYVVGAACAGISGSLQFNENGSVGGSGTLTCPFQYESDQGAADYIDVYLYDGVTGAGVTVQPCASVMGAGVEGEFCSSPVTSSGTGWKVVNVDTGFTWAVYGTFHVRVVLPPNGGSSQLNGYRVVF
jgi:hypothetical protein